jgi:hypothetical protein
LSQSDGTREVVVLCLEATTAQSASLSQACAGPDAGSNGTGVSNQGHFAQGPCSHDGAVGGCKSSSPAAIPQAAWYFASNGFTADQVRQVCSASGGTFLTP